MKIKRILLCLVVSVLDIHILDQTYLLLTI